jgi:PKD repeat protein
MTKACRCSLGAAVVLGVLVLLAACVRFEGPVDFLADPTSGTKPLAVSFSMAACGSIQQVVWSFGDGETSTERNPVHTYEKAGTYTVTLLVTPRGGDPVATVKEDYITVRSGMQAGRITPIYWTEAGVGTVQRCLRDGSLVQALDMSIDAPGDVVVSGSVVYWADTGDGEIVAHDLTTSVNTVLASGRYDPYGVAVDAQGGKVYWTELYMNPAGIDGMVKSIPLAGGSPASVLQTQGHPYDIAYDSVGGKLYWTQHFSILPRSLGGSYGIAVRNPMTGLPERVLSGLAYTPVGIAVDGVNGKVYWTGGDAVHRCNLNGTGVETIVSGADDPRGIAVDPELGKIYWGEDGRIRQANLDGSGVQTILDDLGQVIGLTLG